MKVNYWPWKKYFDIKVCAQGLRTRFLAKHGYYFCRTTGFILRDPSEHDTSSLTLDNRSYYSKLFLFLSLTRIEEFAKEQVDLTLSTSLEFNMPLADLSDVKTMMDSINVVPGLIHTLKLSSCTVILV